MLLFLSDHIIIEVIKENKNRKKYIGIQNIQISKYNIDLVMSRITVFIIFTSASKMLLSSVLPSKSKSFHKDFR